MTQKYSVASLNINGFLNYTNIIILENFLWTQETDIALLQEVRCPQLDSIRRYTGYIKFGVEKQGTAILAKYVIILTDIRFLPSGRGIAIKYNGIWFIKVPRGCSQHCVLTGPYECLTVCKASSWKLQVTILKYGDPRSYRDKRTHWQILSLQLLLGTECMHHREHSVLQLIA
jgi:hypothetical protein